MAITSTVASSLTTVTGATTLRTPVPSSALAVPINSSPTLTAAVPALHAGSTTTEGGDARLSMSYTVSGPSAIVSDENIGLSRRK